MTRILLALFLMVLMVGCNDSGPATTSSDTTSGQDTTPGADTQTPQDTGNPLPTGVTWADDIAPLVYENCMPCHREGNIAPVAFEAYESARDYAPLMARKTRLREMPPWGADNSGDCHTWMDPRWLSDDEIRLIAGWLEEGTPSGDLSKVPALPPEQPALETVDLTVTMDEAYTPQLSPDDYRCFVLDPQLDTDQFLTAFEVKPGVAEQVHHVILYGLNDAEADAQAEALDAGDSVPGYTCFGGANVNGTTLLGAWAPGERVARYPEGTGVRLKAGRKLVMQIHYNVKEGAVPDQTSMDLALSPSVGNEAYIVLLADPSLNVAPGQEAGTHTRELDLSSFGAPIGVTLRGVFPHMHQLGTEIRFSHKKAGSDAFDCLMDVPRWDFQWQQFFFYEDPVRIEPADTLKMECVYDTTGQTQNVRWGEGTDDEMCLVGVYVTLF